MPRFIGLDLHKQYLHLCEWLPAQQQGRHQRIPNTATGWDQLLAQLDCTCWVAVEVTGNAFELHDRLAPHIERVILANPLGLKRLGSGRHTDRVDALRLAQMLALGTLPAVWVPPQPVREMRRLLQYRGRLVSHVQRLHNQAKAVLQRYGQTAPRGEMIGRWLSAETLAVLPAADKILLLSALRQREAVVADLKAIDAEVAQRLQATPAAERLLTITGVGPVTAAAVWAALGDACRFASAKQVTRYAGLDPSVHQSGESYHHGHISKNGNGLLRTILIEAANSVARYDTGELGAFYRARREQLGHKRAIVALARKLLIVAWRLLITGEEYRANKPAAVQRKRRALAKAVASRIAWDEVAAALLCPSEEGTSEGQDHGRGHAIRHIRQAA
jgi:transposase